MAVGVGEQICKDWMINNEEYRLLDERFGNLAEFASWELYRKNSRNNHTNEQTDIAQDLRMALMRAGSYYKRQVYIEACLELCKKYATDSFMKLMVDSLQDLWDNKTRHGANRQKFGPYQETVLYKLLRKIVPKAERPDKNALLRMDSKFTTYCKAITWNEQKSMGKKITREKVIRASMCSLSEFDYLGAM